MPLVRTEQTSRSGPTMPWTSVCFPFLNDSSSIKYLSMQLAMTTNTNLHKLFVPWPVSLSQCPFAVAMNGHNPGPHCRPCCYPLFFFLAETTTKGTTMDLTPDIFFLQTFVFHTSWSLWSHFSLNIAFPRTCSPSLHKFSCYGFRVGHTVPSQI